jgi:hypothetical protein
VAGQPTELSINGRASPRNGRAGRNARRQRSAWNTQAGTFSFTIQVTDTQGNSVTATVTITINP